MRSRIINSFFQIPINVDDLTSSHEFIFLMTPRMSESFQEGFQFILLTSIRGITIYDFYNLMKCIF